MWKQYRPYVGFSAAALAVGGLSALLTSGGMKEFAPRYMLIVDRKNNLDTFTVQVEIRQEYFTGTFDTPAAIEMLEKKLASRLKSVLSIAAKVQLKAPNTIERSQGKSAHVIDLRTI